MYSFIPLWTYWNILESSVLHLGSHSEMAGSSVGGNVALGVPELGHFGRVWPLPPRLCGLALPSTLSSEFRLPCQLGLHVFARC